MSPRGGGGGGRGYSPRAGPIMPPLPDHPPFKAYVGNVPFDIDEGVVDHFFRGLKISDIMVTRHRDTGRAKGCFVEFASQQDLKNALTMNGADLLRRPVSIQVAEPKHGGGGRGGGRDRDSFFGGGGGGRGGDRRGGGGGGYSRFDEDRGDSGGRWNQVRDIPLVEPSSPRERPKLILKPRRAAEDAGDAGAGAAGDSGAKPNPFGGARPANTAAKLQELEEKDRQRKADAVAARAAAKAAVEGGGRFESKKEGAAEREAPAGEQIRERTEPHRPPPGLSQAPGGGGGGGGRGRVRGDRRDRDRDRERGGDRRGGQRERGSGAGGEPGGLSHHRQGDSGRSGRGERSGRGGGASGEKTEKAAAAAAEAPPPARVVAAPGEDAVPKTKVSNPFDLLGNE